ncbi:MAG: multicopper oxidase domain-containing protein [Deltaproteobacteria bacterium]|nr:multicopper oxidase domain-containing protein [Deltaproteobacteria bacterium]
MQPTRTGAILGFALALAFLLAVGPAHAIIEGISGTNFAFSARAGTTSFPDGSTMPTWSFCQTGGDFQYPGPTLKLTAGQTVTITLKNELPPQAGNVSMVFPGHKVTATGGVGPPGHLVREAANGGGTVTYTFTVPHPGTYCYYSGTNMDVQIDMGLVGAMIVYPSTPGQAYDSADSAYDREYLFLETEMDPVIHQAMACAQAVTVDTTAFFPVYWHLNGRSAPDTMAMANADWLPAQPYNCWPQMEPGERMLMRIINMGRDTHPFHHHGNNATIIARDGRLLQSPGGTGADLAESDFTQTVACGSTQDAIFTWTGEGLGWDIYGHAPTDPTEPNEYTPDHGKPFPVTLPQEQELVFGGLYSGSPFLGAPGYLPPGEGGMNPYGGFAYMWHSHNEKEMTTNDIFPGGMMTNCIIQPPGTLPAP